MRAASLGTFALTWSATARHWALAASGVSWAKAVAMNAETTRRPLFPACASTLRMKWTRGLLKNLSQADSLEVLMIRGAGGGDARAQGARSAGAVHHRFASAAGARRLHPRPGRPGSRSVLAA